MARLRGTKWQADVILNGKRQRKTFNTKQEAEQFESDSSISGTTVGNALPALAKELYKGTKDEVNCLRIADQLVELIGANKKLTDITTSTVEQISSGFIAKGNKPRTINTKLTRLSKMLKKAKRKGWINHLPDIELNKVKGGRVRFLSDTEEQRLRAEMPVRFHGLFDFLLYTGCRMGEALALRWDDITDQTVSFWDTKHGNRTIPLVSRARAGIPWSRHNELARPFSDIPYESFYHSWLTARRRAGLGRDNQVVPHVLRHTCASRLVQRGVDIRRVKDWLGHSTIQMTMRYAHLSPSDLYSAADALESGGQTLNVVPKAVAQ